MGETSTLCTGGSKSDFTWDNTTMMFQHSLTSGIPFLLAYVGHPTHQEFYNICYLAHYCSKTDSSASAPIHEHNIKDGTHEQALSSLDPLVQDVNEQLDENIDHICSLLQHPLLSDKQLEYTFWHHKLGHLLHVHLQELVKLGKLPQCLHSCTPLVCPACLFAKQMKLKWHH